MADLGTLVIRLGVDNTGLESGLRALDNQMRLVQSQFRLATSNLTNFGNGSDALRVKANSLTQQLDIQRQRVALLQRAYDESAASKGRDAAETQRLETRLNNAQAAMNRTQQELVRVNDDIRVQESGWSRLGGALTGAAAKCRRNAATEALHGGYFIVGYGTRRIGGNEQRRGAQRLGNTGNPRRHH